MTHKLIKKILIVGLILVCIGAGFTPIINGTSTPYKDMTHVTLTEAQIVAQAKLHQMQKTDYTIEQYKSIQNKNTLLCYLFTLAPEGYLIVSARHDLIPIQAYSFTNDFGTFDYATNPLLRLLITDLQYQIDHIKYLPVEIRKSRNNEWNAFINSDFQGRMFQQWPPEGSTPTGGWVLTQWTQSAPYNNFCPLDKVNGGRSVAGCPAVAMAQILNYHETTRNTHFTDADDYYHNYGGNTFWIDNNYITYQFPSWPQLNTYLDTLNNHWDQHITLTNNDKAAINVACGFAMHQVYNVGGSGTFGVDQADTAYQRFGFEDAELIYPSNPDLFNRLSSNIMNALPAHIAVVDPGWQYGHNMVVDGYNTDDYYHINFGWGGPYDGWYHIPNDLPYGLTVIEGVIVDILPDTHIMDLPHFPWYLSQVNNGAMTMKMIMDYLMWNSTTDPNGPPSVYNEQTLYNTYKGTDTIINGAELCNGLNTEVDDQHHNWMYGYFFAPCASTNANDVLKHICIWLDYPIDYYNDLREVDVPKPGHPNHAPIAVPTGGNYDHWMVVRGIHTDRNAWPPPMELTVYGFWLNDPSFGGLGNNTYVTIDQFLSTYYQPLNVPGDTYNGKYLTITDPYQDYDQSQIQNTKISIGHTSSTLTKEELTLIRLVENNKEPLLTKNKITNIIVTAAINQTMNILQYNNQELAASFAQPTIVQNPAYKNGCWTVQVSNNHTIIKVLLDKECKLLEFSINGSVNI